MARVDYPALLEEAWQQHLAPRAENAPTAISIFAGCGGSSLGYSMAGYRELLAVEWDKNACMTFRLNFPEVPVYEDDIAQLSVEKCLEMAGLQVGELDVLDGSPPCQGFSTAGKRHLEDARNGLAWEFIRLLRGLQPRAFIMENVSGMVKGKMKLVFSEIMRGLKASGYKVRCKLLNAMYFQVPQSRPRLIWIGVRDGQQGNPTFPNAKDRLITVSQAWEGLVDTEGVTRISDYVFPIWQNTPAGESLEVGAAKVLGRKRYFTHRKLAFNRPCSTIQKSIGSLIYHPTEPRGISLPELARLGSFPDAFQFTDRGSGWAQIGNSVPPLFMRAIATCVRGQLSA